MKLSMLSGRCLALVALLGAGALLGWPALGQAEEPPAPAPAPAPPPPAPAPVPAPAPAPTPVPVERMGVELKLGTLVEAVAKKTGATFAWDPMNKMMSERVVRLTRDVVSDGSADLALLRRALGGYEQVLIPMGEPSKPLYLIIDARQQGAILKLKAQPVEVTDANVAQIELMDGIFVTATLRVSGMANLRDLRTALSRIVTGQNIGSVTEVPDGGVLIVTDFAPNVAAIYRTIRQVEAARAASPSAGAGGRVTTLRLQHAVATDLAALLSQTFAPPPLTQVQINNGMSQPSSARILADARTNQLVVTGTQAEIAAVLDVVRALDVPGAAGNGQEGAGR